MSVLALLAVLAAAPAAAAGPSPAGWEEAKAAYDAGRHEQAAAAFARLAEQRPRDAATRRDLGLALYRAGRLGPAIAQLERSLELDPRDADARRDHEFLLRRAGEEAVPPGVPAAAFAAFTVLSAGELSGLNWLCAWLACLLGAVALLAAAPRRAALAPWVAAAALAWAGTGLWRGALRALLPPSRGVIVASRAELRSGPGETFSVGHTAPEGRRVRVLSESGGWLEVGLLKEGVKGWVRASAVERL